MTVGLIKCEDQASRGGNTQPEAQEAQNEPRIIRKLLFMLVPLRLSFFLGYFHSRTLLQVRQAEMQTSG